MGEKHLYVELQGCEDIYFSTYLVFFINMLKSEEKKNMMTTRCRLHCWVKLRGVSDNAESDKFILTVWTLNNVLKAWEGVLATVMVESILPAVLTSLLLLALFSLAYRKKRNITDDMRFRIKVRMFWKHYSTWNEKMDSA